MCNWWIRSISTTTTLGVAVLMVVAGLTLGCGPVIQLEDDTGSGGATSTSTTSPGTTTMPPPGTTVTPPVPDGTTGTTTGHLDDSPIFLDSWGDGSGVDFECSLFEQDCPVGEKCMPWANDGGAVWNATRCSPIDNEPAAVGEPCTALGSFQSGIDSCDERAVCWGVDLETLEGTCVATCVGSPDRPLCENPGAHCATEEWAGLALCLPVCHPLLQDCPEGHGCYPEAAELVCAPDLSADMGAAGDPCEYGNRCDPGTACLGAAAVPGCVGAVGCCSPFCDVTDPMPPCLPGQLCLPWYEEGSAPTGYEAVGACALPP